MKNEDGDAIGFSYFFRDVAAIDLIIQYALPEVRSNKYINIWSAGCSEGQEPYTLAIKLRENLGQFAFRRIKIFASDIDNTTGKFGDMIKKGVYPKKMVERVDPNILNKYFQPINDGTEYEIIPKIRNVIEFKKHDLLTFKEIRRGFNIILCKNVLMHFNISQRIGVIKMFHKSLADGGFLVMERTQKMPIETSSLFERVTIKGQIFRKK